MPQNTAMQNVSIYEALAQALAAGRVDTHFALMGDGRARDYPPSKYLE